MGMHFAGKILLSAYSGLWQAARPLLKRHRRMGDGFSARLVPDDWPALSGSGPACGYDAPGAIRVWMQSASGGEARLAHSLVPALLADLSAHAALASRPLRLLCTSCTRQGLDVLEKLRLAEPHRVFPRFFPLDSPKLMEKAVRQAAPHLIVLLETELWPGLLAAAKGRNVPVMMLNARMTDKSFAAYRLLSSFWRELAPQEILAVSEQDADRFSAVYGHAGRVSLMFNMKFDLAAVSLAVAKTEGIRATAGIPEHALLVALGSVREEEEDLLLPVIRALRAKRIHGHSLAFAVAPRHMHRVDAWRNKLDAAGIPCLPRSGPAFAGEEDSLPVLLWDTFGELPALYAAADTAFVGGSLVPLGGQNFLEAAAQGVAPLVGPYTGNFHWVGEDFFTRGLAVRIQAGELETALERALSRRALALRQSTADASAPDWAAARRAQSEAARRGFASWLAPHRGGSMQAACAVRQKLLTLF